MHAQAALLDELQVATKREAEQAQKKRADEAAAGAEPKAEGAAAEAPAQAPQPQAETIDLTSDFDESSTLPSGTEQAPTNGAQGAALQMSANAAQAPTDGAQGEALEMPQLDANAIIQQYIQQMPDQSAAASAAPSTGASDIPSFDVSSLAGLGGSNPLGGNGLGSGDDSVFSNFEDITNFDFGGGGGSGAGELGLGGDLSALELDFTMAGPSTTDGDFDFQIQSFDQSTSRDQH